MKRTRFFFAFFFIFP
ncbi:pheA operon leader peptide PheL [Salmonella enterica]